MINSFGYTRQITGTQWFPLVFLPISCLFVLLYSYSTSPLFIYEGMDSCIFKTIGLAILQGKMPYVDIFDHKGPILYYINALGQFLIPGRLGIFLLQVLWLSISLCFLFSLAKLFVRSNIAFLVVLVTLLTLAGFYQGGNLCEEWELLAVSISIYLAAHYLLFPSTKTLFKYSLVWGICFGYIFFIRPNDAISQIGGIMAGICLFLIQKKEYRCILKSTTLFIIAALLIFLPILLFFLKHNALSDMMYGLIYHNALYSGGIMQMLLSFFSIKKISILIFFVTIGLFSFYSNNKSLLYLLVPICGLSLLLLGKRLYPHYFITVIPLFLLFWVFLFTQRKLIVKIASLVILCLCSYGSSVFFIEKAGKETASQLSKIIKRDIKYQIFYDEASKLVELIPIEERNDIWNYNMMWPKGPDFSILYHFGIVQCNKVPFYAMYMVDQRLKEIDNIQDHNPKWVFISHDSDSEIDYYGFTSDYEYITSNYYLAGACNSSICNVELYHRTIKE